MAVVMLCEITDHSVAVCDGGPQTRVHYCNPAARNTVS